MVPVLCLLTLLLPEASSLPHIVLILADDLGWGEVSWHGGQAKTPHMARLSGEGVRLDQSYVHPKCSPSRAALMTGVYPHKLGRQRKAIGRFVCSLGPFSLCHYLAFAKAEKAELFLENLPSAAVPVECFCFCPFGDYHRILCYFN